MHKEIEIENFIWDRLGTDDGHADLKNRGLYVYFSHAYRQFIIPNCGIVDLLMVSMATDPDGNKFATVKVYELKRDMVVTKHVGQLARYLAHLSGNVSKLLSAWGGDTEITFRGYLVGRDFERDALAMADQTEAAIQCIGFHVSLEQGIVFREVDYTPGEWDDTGDSGLADLIRMRVPPCEPLVTNEDTDVEPSEASNPQLEPQTLEF
jgi:hypothetical protein